MNNDSPTHGNMIHDCIQKSLVEIWMRAYKTNDIVVLPMHPGEMLGRNASINGKWVRLQMRQAIFLQTLARHGRALPRQPFLAQDDISNLSSLLAKLVCGTDSFTSFLRKQIKPEKLELFRNYPAPNTPEILGSSAVVEELNKIIKGPSLWDDRRLADVKLSKQARVLHKRNSNGAFSMLLNRLLLHEVYSREIAKPPLPFISVEQIVWDIMRSGEEAEHDIWKEPSEPDVYRAVDSLRKRLHAVGLNKNLIEGDRGFGFRLSTPWWNIILDPRQLEYANN